MAAREMGLCSIIVLGLITAFISLPGSAGNANAQDSIVYSREAYSVGYGNMGDLITRREHCSVTRALALELDIAQWDQVRVRRECDDCGMWFGLYTVSIIEDDNENKVIRMGRRGRLRINPDGDLFNARICTTVAHPTLRNEKQARSNNELVEEVADNGTNTRLIAMAPHGGLMEKRTDEQALRVAVALGDDGSYWACYGFNPEPGPGAYDTWHISSTDLNENGFPQLDQMLDRGFEYAVAFHGYQADDAQVIIGGNCEAMIGDESIQETISRIIGEKTNQAVTVTIAQPGDAMGGFDPDNIVNRMALNGGVQLEQSPDARANHENEIADAVSEAFELLFNQ